MKLHQTTKRDIKTTRLMALNVTVLPLNKCPKDKQGNPIPKIGIVTKEGTLYALKGQCVNLPVAFPEQGIPCLVSYETKKILNKEGKEVEVDNVINVSFESTLRYIVESAKAVVAPSY